MMKVMMFKKKEYFKEEMNFVLVVVEVECILKNVGNYKSVFLESLERELIFMVNVLNGGYMQFLLGGDFIVNFNILFIG